MKLHHIEAHGTPRHIAEAVGESLRPEIQTAYALHNQKLARHPVRHIEKKLARLHQATEKYFPEALTELRGLAAGAKVTFREALIFSFEEELLSPTISFEETTRATLTQTTERCSAFAIRDYKQFWFGHNEDWDIPLPLYVLRAKPKNAPAYIAVGNAGQLSGTVAGLNESGIAYSGNSIYGTQSDHGLAKTFCLHSFLKAKKLRDTTTLLNCAPRTLGNNSIIISQKENIISTIEWSAKKLVVHEPPENYIFHTNHFILPKMLDQQMKPPSRSSRLRYKRLNNLIPNLNHPSLVDLQSLMSDHAYNPMGICRHGKSKTLASIIFDVTRQKLHIAYKSPCENPYQTFCL